jgi:hypothetical protein
VNIEECLAEGNEPSEYCCDTVAESGNDPEAEVVQNYVGDARGTFALRPNGDREYSEFRQFLIEHGCCRTIDAIRAIAPSGLALADLYEEIPISCRFRRGDNEFCLPCPICSWPMRGQEDSVECCWRICRSEGPRYRRTESTSRLTPLGRWDVPEPVLTDGRLRLRRVVWRYTLLPGLVELDLAARLRKLGKVAVEMWPQRDRYDLHVEANGWVWRVDVKDWSNPMALASSLSRSAPGHETVIVVPDRRKYQIPILRQRVPVGPPIRPNSLIAQERPEPTRRKLAA